MAAILSRPQCINPTHTGYVMLGLKAPGIGLQNKNGIANGFATDNGTGPTHQHIAIKTLLRLWPPADMPVNLKVDLTLS